MESRCSAERLGGLHEERGVGADAIAVTAAKETAGGLAGGFPEDVPESDIDAADGVGEGATASHPEGVGVEFFGDALGFEGVLAKEERFEDAERALDESVVGEDGAPAGDAFVGVHGEQGVDAVAGFDFVGPAAFGRGAAEACGRDFGDFHGER